MSNLGTLSISDTNILDMCCKVEEVCGEIYQYFSGLFIYDKPASALWLKTSLEENNHAEQFRLACRIKGAGIRSLEIDTNEVSNLLNKMNGIHEIIQTSPPTLKAALQFAIKMEYALAKYHMSSAASFDDENSARLFTTMLNCDKNHITMLENALKDWFG